MSADENKVGLNDFSALNLVHDYNVWCHYTSSEDEVIRKYMAEYDLKKVIVIPETAGLYVTEESIDAVGPANVKVFGIDNREARPGEKITF